MTSKFYTLLGSVAFCSVFACGGPSQSAGPDATDLGNDGAPDAAVSDSCPTGAAGNACVIALAKQVAPSCQPAEYARLFRLLDERAQQGPLWSPENGGEALFRADSALAIAGQFNNWSTSATATTALCGSREFIAIAGIPVGHWQYKLVRVGAQPTWMLDANNPAFAFDDFSGNPDRRNSVLNTAGSSRGHLVDLGELCSPAQELGNCRRVTAYLPPDYWSAANSVKTYPTLYMHDGQNIFDDKQCCFGHTGWEVNVAIDRELAANQIKPVIVVGVDHGGVNRNPEYGFAVSAGGKLETFVEFFVSKALPFAEAKLRIDPGQRFVAGSSLGGLVSSRLALAHPETFRAAASLSGAFWPGQDDGTAMRDILRATGKKSVAFYLDHGGTAAGGDGYADSVEVKNILGSLGWQMQTSPNCQLTMDSVCYHHEPGATHDELAWRDRVWRMLRYFVAK